MDNSPTPERLRTYKVDPRAFIDDQPMETARGLERFGDCMEPHQREWRDAMAPSLVALANGQPPPISRFWLEATKGAAKTTFLALCAVWLLAFANRALLVVVLAADQDQARELLRAARDLLRFLPWMAGRVLIFSDKIVCEATGAECAVVTTDIYGSHGGRPDWLIVDEIVHVEKREAVANHMDNASKVGRGVVTVATNAGFYETWQWQWRELARESDRWFFHVFAQPVARMSEAELSEAERRNSPERFRRLWWGVWSTGAGNALDQADIDAAIVQSFGPMTGKEPDHIFLAGLDLSTRRDHSALIVVACNVITQRLRLANCFSWQPGPDGKVDLMDVQQSVIDAFIDYRLSACCYDPFQAELMSQQLARIGCNMVEVPFVGQRLNEMATCLLEVFRSRQIDLYPDPELVTDLGRLSIVERAFGYKLDAPRDKAMGHCDKAIALSMVLPVASECVAAYREIPDDPVSSIFDPRFQRDAAGMGIVTGQQVANGWNF